MALSIKLDADKASQNELKQNSENQRAKKQDRKASSKIGSKRKSPMSRKKKFLLAALILIILLCGGGLMFYSKLQNVAEEIGIKIKPTDLITSVISNTKPELKRDSTGKRTNVLMVGVDTRVHNQGLLNTDTIIVASYNHDTNETVMISIPRDIYAEIPGEGWFIKINGIYGNAEMNEEGSGMDALEEAVETFTGLEIQYYGMVDLEGFVEIIDIVGGVDIYVENSFTDYEYPNSTDSGYEVVSFNQGPQTMDGKTALKFARSRKSLGPEGSDFARARRQQKVIEALKEKVLSTETLLNPNKILDLMDSLESRIKVSDITVEDIDAGVELLKKNGENNNSYTFVMDPSIGDYGILTTGVIPEAYSIGPKLGLGNYTDLHAYIDAFMADPELYEASPAIYIYDTGFGYYETLDMANQLVEEYPFISIYFQGTLFNDKVGTVIYDNNDDKDFENIVERLSNALDARSTLRPDYISTGLNGEDIVILVGSEIEPEPAQQN